jgi:hypothetical protein
MRAILWVAYSFFRQQRLVVLVLLLFTIFLLAVFLTGPARDAVSTELLVPFLQLIGYGILIPFLLCTQMMYLERKTRRILGVLAKGIHRWQYLVGMWLAGILVALAQLLGLGVGMQIIAYWRGWELHIWDAVGVALVAAMLAGAIASLFGCFLHPMVSTFLGGALIGIPYWLSARGYAEFEPVLPVASVFRSIMRTALRQPWDGDAWLLVMALAQAALLLFIASQVFARVDAASAVE